MSTTEVDKALESVAGDAQAIIDTATRAAGPHVLTEGSITAFVVPAGGGLQVNDDRCAAEAFAPAPRRTKGTTTLLEPASFVRFVQDIAPSGEALTGLAVYADIVGCRTVTAVFNGPSRDHPGWGDHRAVLTLTPTESWKRWLAQDGRLGEQVAFAEHVGNNVRDIVDPSGAEMLEVAQHLEASVKGEFREANRLSNGQRQFVWTETITAKAGELGQAVIPERFLLELAPFEGAERQVIEARLRYRIREGKLTIGYVLDRPDLVLRTSFVQVLAGIEEAIGPAYRGSPAEQ